jgi:outer membrane protein TolC
LDNVPLVFPVLRNQYALQASISVPVSDYLLRVPQAVSASRYGERAAKFNETATKRRVAADARLAYYSWVQARLETVIAQQALAQSEAHLADTRHALDAGAGTMADVLAVQAQVASSRLLVESSRSMARIAEERIRVALHDPKLGELRIGEDVRVNPAPLGADSSVAALVRASLVDRPELRALDARVASARRNVAIERVGMLPRLDGFANAYYSNPNARVFPQRDEFQGTWDAGGALTWTVSDIPGASASTRKARAEVVALRAERRKLEDSIRVEVAEALENARLADASIAPAEERLTAATEAYRVRRALFQNGRATSVELTDAEAELTQARIDALNARVNQRVARVRLAHAVGRAPMT